MRLRRSEYLRSGSLDWRNPFLILAVGLVLLAAVGSSATASANGNLCAGCHGDKTRLKSQSPRWRDVYVDPAQYAQDKHGRFACTTCHGGDKNEDSPKACVGVALRDPAAPEKVEDTCGSCHPDITARHLDSLHSTMEGHRLSLVDLMGEKDGLAKFEACKGCHATCSSCHMEQPDSHNKLIPLTENHSFARRPSSDVCKACHGQTGDTYLGIAGDQRHGPSVMATAGLQCADCHTEKEVHGNGGRPSFISETAKPACEDCHSQPSRLVHTPQAVVAPQYDPANPAHQTHQETVSCEACHTQWYYNCWDCHKGTERVKNLDKFFLAQNPLTGKVQTAAHSPVSWELGGVPPELGGWAVKSRHSWSKSQTCEKCHTDPAVYIDQELRQAQFVSFWATQRAKGSFVDAKLVQQMIVNQDKLKRDIHKDTACMDCHKSLGDDVCADCHAKTKKSGTTYLPADADWSRSPYVSTTNGILQETQELLEQARKSNLEDSGWQKQWTELRDRYLETANDFHGNPGPAQERMREISLAAGQFKSNLGIAVENANRQQLQVTAGLPLVLGFVVALGAGTVFTRRKMNRHDRKR